MSLKRRFERDAEQNSPAKRCRCDVTIPQTPTQGSVLDPFLPSTPYTPYPLQPSDSPTNPFKGKKKVETLPPVTSFSKHIPLRFQFHRRNVGFQKGGVHRVVQVPLNYTFTHLRALIAWLFDTPTPCPIRKAGDDGYLFEVKTNVAMESPLMKPGMIKSGVTSVKLSNVRDPWRKRYGQNADDEDELDEECDETGETPDEESDDWIWADEDDHTLEHVWVAGVSADRGIIYHHSSDVLVHISVNTMKLPRRRGKSNVPYVFFARGRVHLSPRPIPRPVFTRSILHTLSSSPAGPSIGNGKRAHSIPESPKRSDRSLPNSHSPEGEELTDTDADGDPYAEDENPFHDNHPFSCSPDRQTSPLRKVAQIGDKNRSNHSSEIVYVKDSGDEDKSRGSDDDESEDETIEVYDRLINPDHWNEFYYTYGRYLLSFLDDRGRSFDHIDDEYFEGRTPYDPFDNDDDDDENAIKEGYVEEDSMEHPIEIEDEASTPELTSSTSPMSPLPPSSPPTQTLSSSPAWHHHLCSTPPSSVDPLSLSPDSSLELHPGIIALHYPNKKHTITPAPPKARKHRVRIDRLERRLEKFKKGKYLCANDEVEREEEVDELLDDDEEPEEVGGEDEDTEHFFWGCDDHSDPFGDEIEI